MDWVAITVMVVALLAGILGVLGSFLPIIPGPPISWLGLLVIYIWGTGTNANGETFSLTGLILWGLAMVIVTIIDYVVPSLLTTKMGGSKYAGWGSLIGMIIGLIVFQAIGMIIGAFLGALIAELAVSKKEFLESLKIAASSFLGFLLGTGIKAILTMLILWRIIVYIV